MTSLQVRPCDLIIPLKMSHTSRSILFMMVAEVIKFYDLMNNIDFDYSDWMKCIFHVLDLHNTFDSG